MGTRRGGGGARGAVSGSRARLEITGAEGRLRVASANAPQRWAAVRPAADGWIEAVHQTIGDGVFAGELHRTSIAATEGARVVVRGITAVPLRGPRPSGTATSVRVGRGASVCLLPGALIPQTAADHSAALRIDVDADATALAASIVVPGRSGMGERGAFRRLRLRTTARVAGRLAFLEDATIEPERAFLDGPAGYRGFDASLTVIALGAWAPASVEWWDGVAGERGVGGASLLREGGVCYRALFPTLGDALASVAFVERRVRALPGV
ncbi:MAG: urease accessory protein UreD [Dehalococcoidia bacterium]